jgi:hypothetical protein
MAYHVGYPYLNSALTRCMTVTEYSTGPTGQLPDDKNNTNPNPNSNVVISTPLLHDKLWSARQNLECREILNLTAVKL